MFQSVFQRHWNPHVVLIVAGAAQRTVLRPDLDGLGGHR